jgi:hypothetical protein
MDKEKIKKAIERRFLKIRGWKDWEEYDRIQESTELDKNIRWELIEIAIQETQKTSNKNQKQNVQEGVSNSDTLRTTQTASSDNPQDDPGQTSGVANEDTGDGTFPADLNLYKCGHKTNGTIIMDDNLLSMSAYIQWAEEENNLETKKECFECFLKKLDGNDS